MRRGLWVVLGLLVLAAGAVALLPLQWVTSRYLPGLEAQSVTGSIWKGRVRGASWQGVPVGDVDLALDPQSLLRLEPEARFERLQPRLGGRAHLSAAAPRVSDVRGSVLLPIAGEIAAVVMFDDVDATLGAGGRCRAASGRVSATVEGLPFLGATPPLSGALACADGVMSVALRPEQRGYGLDLWLRDGRQVRAELLVEAQAPLVRTMLGAAGFAPAPDGMRLAAEFAAGAGGA